MLSLHESAARLGARQSDEGRERQGAVDSSGTLAAHPHKLLVGFTGRSGSGKTTIADAAQRRLYDAGSYAGVFKFADPIRDMLAVVGVTKGDREAEAAHPLFRRQAQIIGQSFRDADPDFWVRRLLDVVSKPFMQRIVLIDDVRYANEAAACDLVVKLITSRDCGLTAEQMAHRSEREWETLRHDLVAITDDPKEIELIAATVTGIILSAANATEPQLCC